MAISQDELDHIKLTQSNAKRLINDAKTLTTAGGHLSGIILAILGIEELGKSFIKIWGVKNEASKRIHPSHIEKQGAVFALLSANELLKKIKKNSET